MALRKLPSELPVEALSVVVELARRRPVDKTTAHEALNDAIGYAQHAYLAAGDAGPVLFGSVGSPAPSEEELVVTLEGIVADQYNSAPAVATKAVPWGLLVPLFVEILKRLLNG